MGTKAIPPPRRDAPNASAALDRFFEVRLKPHVEGVARRLRRQFRTDLRAAVQVVVEAVAAAAAATVVDEDEDDEDDDDDDAPPTKRKKRAATNDADDDGMDDVGVEDDDLDHSHDLGDFSDDGVVSDAEGDETTSDEDDDDDDDDGEGED